MTKYTYPRSYREKFLFTVQLRYNFSCISTTTKYRESFYSNEKNDCLSFKAQIFVEFFIVFGEESVTVCQNLQPDRRERNSFSSTTGYFHRQICNIFCDEENKKWLWLTTGWQNLLNAIQLYVRCTSHRQNCFRAIPSFVIFWIENKTKNIGHLEHSICPSQLENKTWNYLGKFLVDTVFL